MTSGITVKAVHLTDLRAALIEVSHAIEQTPPSYGPVIPMTR